MGVRSLFSLSAENALLSINEKYFVIDPISRGIAPPSSFKNFGVESDENSNRIWFECPRYVGDSLDLSALNLRVNYQNAKGEKDQYIVDDVIVDGDFVRFSWLLSRKCTMYSGIIMYLVCAVKTDSGGAIVNEWNTTICTGTVLGGLEVEAPEDVSDIQDVVSQLLDLTKNAVSEVETKSTEAVENVQAAEAAAIQNVENAAVQHIGNLAANAIKGKLSGEIVSASDVSPVEHELSLIVHGKNLWDMSRITDTDSIIQNNDGTVTVKGGVYYGKTAQTLAQICPALRVGDTVTFTISTEGDDYIYLMGVELLIAHGKTVTITADMLNSIVVLYGVDDSKEDYTVSHTITSIQIEFGEVATEYTPYIDPAAVTVERYGKNLCPCNEVTYTLYGYTVTLNEDGSVTVTGAADTTDPVYIQLALRDVYGGLVSVPLKANQKYTLTAYRDYVISSEIGTRIDYTDGSTEWLPATEWNNSDHTKGRSLASVFIESKGHAVGDTRLCGTYKIQLEAGEVASDYEAYRTAVDCTPNSDGIVSGLLSLSPHMTICTDTSGVTIKCEYNRDTNKVIAEIYNRLLALESI